MNSESLIGAVRDYIALCPLLEGAACYTDWTEDNKSGDNAGVFPEGDSPTGNGYIDGSEERVYSFVIHIRKTADSEEKRLGNQAFSEKLREWIGGNIDLIRLPAGYSALSVLAYDEGKTELEFGGKKGVYQIKGEVVYLKFPG